MSTQVNWPFWFMVHFSLDNVSQQPPATINAPFAHSARCALKFTQLFLIKKKRTKTYKARRVQLARFTPGAIFEHANCRQTLVVSVVLATDDIVGWSWRNIDHVMIRNKSGSVRIVLNGCPVTRAKVVNLGLDVLGKKRANRQEAVLKKKVHFKWRK